MLQNLDAFGIHYVLTFDGQLKYKTSLGGLMTIFTCLFLLGMTYLLGSEILAKKKPNDIKRVLTRPTPPAMIFNIR